MDTEVTQFEKLIQLAVDFDNYGQMNRDMSLQSVAIGTLRKDVSIAKDILTLIRADSDGMSEVVLSRVLIEDYLHLLFLYDNPSSLEENIQNFNLHPHIEHFLSLDALREWGIDLSDPESIRVTAAINDAFEANKDRFLRPGRRPSGDTVNPDDYFRTWTKLSLTRLVENTSLTTNEENLTGLKLINETYDSASAIVHHNSFNIWLLACQGMSVSRSTYREMAEMIDVIVLSRTINVVFNMATTGTDEDDRIAQFMERLANIVEGI